jgi:DNA-binding MarR family transcriptional regulator
MPDRSLIRELERATHHVGAHMADELRDLGITQAEAHVLGLLADEGPQPVHSLVAAFGHRPSTLTSVLGRLERRGLIERRIKPADRRSFVILLTPEGTAAATRVSEVVSSFEAKVSVGLPAGSLEGFFSTTDAVAAAHGGVPGKPSG